MSKKKKKIKKARQPVTHGILKQWVNNVMHRDCEESQNKLIKYYENAYNKFSYYQDFWIHENEYKPMNCCLCGKEMTSVHETHNPFPLTPKCFAKDAVEDSLPHRCCDECDVKYVLPKRFEQIKPQKSVVLDAFDFAKPLYRKFFASKSVELDLPIHVEVYGWKEDYGKY
tara:strand:- start:866 stop:1375 length:510 start_codon:yes stop_codon:yes gene_type:complete